MKSLSLLIHFLFVALAVNAQVAGVCPLGASDRLTNQLFGPVHTSHTTTWSVDFSRHVVQKAEQKRARLQEYDASGNILSEQSLDSDGQPLSRTDYVYVANQKSVATTNGFDGTFYVSSRTHYTYSPSGNLVSLLSVDKDSTIISTSSVTLSSSQTIVTESFPDGETITTTFSYDSQFRLQNILRSDGKQTSEMKFKLSSDGVPVKGVYRSSDGSKKTITSEYVFDSHGNWTRRVVYVDGKPFELSERRLTYY